MYNACISLNAPKHENHGLTIYALKLETEKHTYYFCCNPSQHDYNFRVMCYDAKEHLRYKNELLTLTHMAILRQQVTDILRNSVRETGILKIPIKLNRWALH